MALPPPPPSHPSRLAYLLIITYACVIARAGGASERASKKGRERREEPFLPSFLPSFLCSIHLSVKKLLPAHRSIWTDGRATCASRLSAATIQPRTIQPTNVTAAAAAYSNSTSGTQSRPSRPRENRVPSSHAAQRDGTHKALENSELAKCSHSYSYFVPLCLTRTRREGIRRIGGKANFV